LGAEGVTAQALDPGLDPALREALAHPLESDALALVGPPGTGKSFALVQRALYAAATRPAGAVLLATPSDAGTAKLRARLPGGAAGIACIPFATLAFEILRESPAPGSAPVEPIDDARAAVLFESAGAELFSLEWAELLSSEIDPEITGLRAPERFADAAFRLIRKLRAALVSPDDFKAFGLRGATAFYGHPPNLASADLLMETPEKYRDSLRVTPAELGRQHEREVDLVKVLTRLYAAYVETLVRAGCLTATDAVYEATMFLRRNENARERARRRFAFAAIDDAQDLTGAQIGLLAAMFGDKLRGVTLAGDESQATRGFATGARGTDALRRATATIAFATQYRSAPEIFRAATLGLNPESRSAMAGDESGVVTCYRAEHPRDEARSITAEVQRLLAGGLEAERIAIVTRNLRCAHPYVDALLARDVPVDVAGAASLYDFPVTQDALAALWSAVDPFRHDYLLRNLEAPWLRLCDASVATLCGDPADPQPLLFELPEDDDDEAPAARWDRKRDLRLGRNVTRGDVDGLLPDDARARLAAFRAARERWEASTRTLGPGALARAILSESVLATLAPGARGRFEAGLVARLIAAIDDFEAREPLGTLDDFLAYAERVADSETDLLELELRDPHAVRVLDVEAAKGDDYDAVFVPGLQAGTWPRYYAPDAFLFTPSAGMIPKENVGDADAIRTAKFTYTMFRSKLREKYCAEERRAFYCAASRARRRLFLSAAGRATRGLSTPEILVELEKQL
jgi:superfamily I DNA/RNA helicase